VLSAAERETDERSAAIKARAPAAVYGAFEALLYGLIDGTTDASKYEDGCRHLMGNGAYQLYTLDKVITATLKQLQLMATDPVTTQLLALYARMYIDGGAGEPVDLAVYKAGVEKLMNELEFRDDLYLVEYSPDHLTVASEYLGCEDDDAEKPDPASKKQRVE